MTPSTQELPPAVLSVDLPFPKRSGKVREVFDLGDGQLLVVATDRISTYDVVHPNGIPGKGRCLTRLSVRWDELLKRKLPWLQAHLITADAARFPATLQRYRQELEGRAMLVERLTMIPVECIARGYLFGSVVPEYTRTGRVCGVSVPPGIPLAGRLPQPLFTPSTKATTGHDENLTEAQLVARGLATEEQMRALARCTLAVYSFAAKYATNCDVILADTKLEWGQRPDGTFVLADEVLTPDSSRYWPKASYEPGASPPSLDKQYVRDYVTGIGWNKRPPAPELPAHVVAETARKYQEIADLLFP